MSRRTVGGKVYQTFTSLSIIGIFVAIALLVFGIMGFLNLSTIVVGIIISVVILCLSLISTLPWVKRIEDGEMKKISKMFLFFIAICAALWLVCVWMTIYLSLNSASATDEAAKILLVLIKVVVIASAQLMLASYVGNLIIRFHKTMLVFQIITIVSCVFIDFYVTYLLSCVQILPEINIAEGISLLSDKFVVTLLILSILFVIVSNIVIRTADNRRMRVAAETVFNDGKEEKVETTDEKLAKAKDLFDKGLITAEEYEQKRKDLLKDL